MNVKAAQMLTEQLLGYAMRLPAPGEELPKEPSLIRPRHVALDFDTEKNVARLTITPLVRNGAKTQTKTSFTVDVAYDGTTRSFIAPKNIALDIPLPKEADEKLKSLKKVSATEILAKRFPTQARESLNLAASLNQYIFGQEHLSQAVEESMSSYLATYKENDKPNYEILAGFTGIGKTQMVYETAELLGLEIIKFNLQDYSDSQATSAESFARSLNERLNDFRQENPNKPYILLFEELDKVNEIDPGSGAIIDRPVISHIKDLLNEGHKEITFSDGSNMQTIDLDIRDAFLFITMNLPTNIFGFQADPRLTTHKDMNRAYETLTSSQEELRQSLKKMFRDETVNRLISPRFHIAKPLEEEHYKEILDVEKTRVINTRLMDSEGIRNTSGIKLHLSSDFQNEYMMSEGVIPSEGGRQAAESFRSQLQGQIDKALSFIPKSSKLAKTPFDLYLDFKPRSKRKEPRIIATAVTTDPKTGKQEKTVLMNEPVTLRFPRLTAFGDIPESRILVSVHEFGHAFTSALLGHRFEWITVVPPSSGIGGLVKYPEDDIHEHTARQLIARLYTGLGSRAMERIFLSDDPTKETSVLDITSGASSDIRQVTKTLYDLLYSLGFDPKGGTIVRSGLDDDNYLARPEFFSELPADEVTKLGLLLRNIENQLVKFLLEAHPKDWYQKKITDLARVGGMEERDFYKLIGYKFPGEGTVPLGEESNLRVSFKEALAPETSDLKRAKGQEHGLNSQTAEGSLNVAVNAFVNFLEASRPSSQASVCGARLSKLVRKTKN
jgi:hypothetical protein